MGNLMLQSLSSCGHNERLGPGTIELHHPRVAKNSLRKIPFRLQLDIVHPALKQGKQVQPDNACFGRVKSWNQIFLSLAYFLSSHSCTRITTWGIMLKTITTETNSTLWLQLSEWQTTTKSIQGREEGCDTFQDTFPSEKYHPVKGACSSLSPFGPHLKFQLVKILSAPNSIQCFEEDSSAFAIHSSSEIKKLRKCLSA